jgi:hypothetical protein
LKSCGRGNLSGGTGLGRSAREIPNSGLRPEFLRILLFFSPITKEIPIFPLDRISGFFRIYYRKGRKRAGDPKIK